MEGDKPQKKRNRDKIIFCKNIPVTDTNSQNKTCLPGSQYFLKNVCSENEQYFPCEA